MKNLMIVVAFLVVALVAAPAIAENGESTDSGSPVGETAGDATGAPTQETAPVPPSEPPPAEPTPPAPLPTALPTEPTDQGADPTDGDLISATGDDNTLPDRNPNDITSTDTGDVTNTDIGDAGPVEEVSTDLGGGTRDDTVQDLDEDADAEKKAVDTDEVDTEDREDRVADRILADLKDGKKDKDDEDEDDANKDGVEQSTDQDADSGDVDQDADVINTGDNVNQCVGILQVANTGNAQNATGITQFDSESDEIELEDGSSITLTPQLVVDCRQIILQIVRGERPNESKISKAKLRDAILQPRSSAAPILRTGDVPSRVAGVPNRIGGVSNNRLGAGVIVPTSSRSGSAAAPKVLSASNAGQPKASSLRRSLPKTGGPSGYATLLGLGAGTLLIGGGLLVRRLAR